MATTFQDNVQITGSLSATGGITGVNRSGITQETQQVYALPFHGWRIWDSGSPITSPGSDDIGYVATLASQAFGTGVQAIGTGDLNALGAFTRYARQTFTLPPEYVAGGTCEIRFSAGMHTAVASVSCSVDVEIYASDRDGTIGGSDLVATAAQSINSLTWANKTFTVTSAALAPGSVLDIRIQLTGNSATASAHYGLISDVDMLLTIKG